MRKQGGIAIALAILACGVWASDASAKHRAKHHQHAAPVAATTPSFQATPGNNPMTKPAVAKPVANAQPFAASPGNNPMSKPTGAKPVENARPHVAIPGNNPMR